MKKKNKNKTNKNKNIIYIIMQLILLLSSIFLVGVLVYINLLPTKYFLAVLTFVIGYNLIVFLLLRIKNLKRKIKKALFILSVFITLIFIVAGVYITKTLGVLLDNGDSKYKLEHYSVIVLKSDDYEKLSDISNLTVGYYENSAGSSKANKRLKSEVDVNLKKYSASDTLANDLESKSISAILIEDSIKKIIEEEAPEFKDQTKVIYTFSIRVKANSTAKDVNVTKKPFAIYISGIDTYGEISSVSRSDVNIVMVVNPNTKQVLLISVPRDYYVQLHGTTGVRDKLTHAGIYGVDMSVKTLEDLLDMTINYYIKVNFTSVEDIIDALGGVDVYSEYTFVSYSGYSFKKGYNSVNGKQGLDFVRTRKAFASGDRQRGKNQQALIEAMLKKVTSKSIITKYNSLLNSIDGKYQTNMSMKKITSLVKMQLNDMSPWNVTSISLQGTDSNNYTYTYYQKLYVMEPNEESVAQAQEAIKAVISGQKLDSSYTETNYGTNTVSKVKTQTSTNKTMSSANTKQENKQQVKEPVSSNSNTINDSDKKEELEKNDDTSDKTSEEDKNTQQPDNGEDKEEKPDVEEPDETKDITESEQQNNN